MTLFEGLTFTIGIKGYEPGGKEWPTSLIVKQVGGSISSLLPSINFVYFKEPSNVFPAFCFCPVFENPVVA